MEELVAAREAKEGRKAEELLLPEGFLPACGKVYDAIGPIFMAEEMLGCWVFRTTRPLTISGPMGVVIATGELIHFHIPALLSDSGAGKGYAEKVAEMLGHPRETILEELLDEDARRPLYRVPDEFRA